MSEPYTAATQVDPAATRPDLDAPPVLPPARAVPVGTTGAWGVPSLSGLDDDDPFLAAPPVAPVAPVYAATPEPALVGEILPPITPRVPSAYSNPTMPPAEDEIPMFPPAEDLSQPLNPLSPPVSFDEPPTYSSPAPVYSAPAPVYSPPPVDAPAHDYGLPPMAAPAAPVLRTFNDDEPPPLARPVLPPAAAQPGVTQSTMAVEEMGDVLDDLLLQVIKAGASDLHLSPGSPPRMRVHGSLLPMPNTHVLTDASIRSMINASLMSSQKTVFEETHELNFAYQIAGQGRFRGNLMMRGDEYGAVFRLIPWKIKTLGELDMPTKIADFAQLHRGLVLVTGATGSGKSTTLAALLDLVNRTRDGHILTVEDPIEFLHQHGRCVVNQREVGPDTSSFAEALRNALRQDPDVILVGEMRDLETIQVALTAAETGHLVLATLHTSSAKDTISRIVDVFPAIQQEQIRTQLASTLHAVVCQTLCKTLDGNGRVAATELMITNTAIRTAIRDGKIQQIPNYLTGGRNEGMHTLAMDLVDKVQTNQIGAMEAAEKAYNRKELADLLGIAPDTVDTNGFQLRQDKQLKDRERTAMRAQQQI